jgi:DNA-binding response OmpR family regulator/Tfp pilus assembly protein PilF
MSDVHEALRRRPFLLVEDFEAMRGVLKGLLVRCGAARVDTAANGREAANLLRRTSYGVVLCDYNLGPGRNGQQLLEEARHHGWIAPAAVWVMITAEKTNDMVSVAAEDAPDDYLLKPITESMLEARLKKLVERKEALAPVSAAMQAGDDRKALQICRGLVGAGSKHGADLLRLQAQLHHRLGELAPAQAVYESVLQRAPVPWAKVGLAKVLLDQKNAAGACGLLTETVREHPQLLEAYDALAALHAAHGRHDQQLELLERGAAISPNSQARQAALGMAALTQGRTELAAQAFRRSLKLAEHSAVENVDAGVGMARLLTESGHLDEARRLLAETAKRCESPQAQMLVKSGQLRACHAAGDAAGAAALAAELAALTEDDSAPLAAEAALRIAETLLHCGQADGATRLLQYVTRNNHDDETLVRRAQQVYDRAGLAESGAALLAAARRHATDAMSEGMQLLSGGDLAGAVASLRAAKATMPQNARVLLNFAAVALTLIEKNGGHTALEADVRAALEMAQRLKKGGSRAVELLERLDKAAATAA